LLCLNQNDVNHITNNKTTTQPQPQSNLEVVECCVDAFRIMCQASCAVAAVGDKVVADLSFLDRLLLLAALPAHRRDKKVGWG
jgi:hypothetical protein